LKEKGVWIILLLIGVLLVPTSTPPVNAFMVIDHAICKNIPAETSTCEERANEFLPSDEMAWLWVKGTFESSDVGAKIEFRFYDPTGSVFAVGPTTIPGGLRVAGTGEVSGGMGIGVSKALESGIFGGFLWVEGTRQPSSEIPGEWRAELTLNGIVVLSEYFTILGETTAGSIFAELAYDDGTAETSFGYGRGNEGAVLGVQFTAPSTPFQILKIKYYLQSEALTPFAVVVWDQNRDRIFDLEVAAKGTGWFEVDLSKSGLFLTGNDFSVLMKALDKGMERTSPYLGWDTSKPDGKSFCRNSDGTWRNSAELAKTAGKEDGDFMIRVWTQAAKDSDGDGLFDFQENELGSDPAKSDTDGDGLSDGSEVETYNTDPLNADTDNDGFNDGDELRAKTDPLSADTDVDGLKDGDEIARATDPLAADTDGDSWNDPVDIQPRDALIPNALIVVGVIIAVAAVVFVRRRRAPTPTPTYQAPAPAAAISPTTLPQAVAEIKPSVRYCISCGTANRDDSRFCESCGALLDQAGTPMAPLLVDRNARGAALVFPEIDASALTTRVHDFFLAKGYTLESGKPGAGTYGMGSTASRVLFGGLAKRHKFDVAIAQEGSKVKLQLTKAMSGASGGLIGWKAMNTEFDRIVNAFREDFAFADRLQQPPKVPAAITEEDKKYMKQCQSCHAWNPIAAEACAKCGAELC